MRVRRSAQGGRAAEGSPARRGPRARSARGRRALSARRRARRRRARRRAGSAAPSRESRSRPSRSACAGRAPQVRGSPRVQWGRIGRRAPELKRPAARMQVRPEPAREGSPRPRCPASGARRERPSASRTGRLTRPAGTRTRGAPPFRSRGCAGARTMRHSRHRWDRGPDGVDPPGTTDGPFGSGSVSACRRTRPPRCPPGSAVSGRRGPPRGRVRGWSSPRR